MDARPPPDELALAPGWVEMGPAARTSRVRAKGQRRLGGSGVKGSWAQSLPLRAQPTTTPPVTSKTVVQNFDLVWSAWVPSVLGMKENGTIVDDR